MINAKFNVCILVLDPPTSNYKLVSYNKDFLELPYLEIENTMDIDNCLEHIVSSCINKEDSFLSFKLTDVVLDDFLSIYYVVFINHETSIKNGFLLDIQSSISKLPNNAKKIISLL